MQREGIFSGAWQSCTAMSENFTVFCALSMADAPRISKPLIFLNILNMASILLIAVLAGIGQCQSMGRANLVTCQRTSTSASTPASNPVFL